MKKVVIIGGGFAGSLCAKKLEKDFNVILIDTKNYFEFTPGILRTIVEPEHIKKIQVLHTSYLKKTKILIGEVKEINKNFLLVKNKKINYDYLIIASGSSYALPIKQKNVILPNRAEVLIKQYNSLCKSKSVLIVGGGLVGVELTAEIIGRYKGDKKITLIHAENSLINRNHKKSIRYAEKFLKRKGVKIIYNEKVIGKTKEGCFTNKKRKINADIIFLCTGIQPNYKFLKKNFSKRLNKENFAKTNLFLQLEGEKNIFVAGDISNVQEEKTAQNAEKQIKLIVKNINHLEKEENLQRYSMRLNPMVISLGKRNGILEYKNFVLTGLIPGFLKSFIEWKKMKRYR